MVQKDEQLLRLQRLHQRIEEERLQVHISRDKHRSLALNLHYCGDPAFLEFYEMIDLLRTFVIYVTMLAETKQLVRLPLPHGDQHLRQPSGTRILDAATDRTWLTVRVLSAQKGSIHVAKTCPLPVLELIASAAERAERWSVVSMPMHAEETNVGTVD